MTAKRIHFIVTGHIDHGKSTFVGRLLLEMGAIPEDRLENLKAATGNKRLEFSHLTDALNAEREKGITIGISQTVFRHEDQEFVFLDAPGHHEFLQNMITGASRADVAFLVVDAVEGIRESTLRHLHMLSFLGITEIIVVVNKMDLVDYSETIFLRIHEELQSSFARLLLKLSCVIPICAYSGENLVVRSVKMKWYSGSLVKNVLFETATRTPAETTDKFKFVVQDAYEGIIVGELIGTPSKKGQEYIIHRSQQKVVLESDETHFKGKKFQSFKVAKGVLRRGDLLLDPAAQPKSGDRFESTVIWFGVEKIKIGTELVLRLGKQEVKAHIEAVSGLIDSSSFEQIDPNSVIGKGFVLKCAVKTNENISFDYFEKSQILGRFVLLKNGIISGAGKII